MASRCTPDRDFTLDLFEQVLRSDALSQFSAEQRKVLSEDVLPTLFEALPELLQAVQQNKFERSGDLPSWKFGSADAVDKIDPIRWLGEYLFRHNPRHTSPIDTRSEGNDRRVAQFLRSYAKEHASSKEERK